MLLDASPKPMRKLSLTPLIDVVFLLLVFFMLASTFTKFSSLHVSGAKAAGGAVQAGEIAFIRLHEDGGMDFNGQDFAAQDLAVRLNAFADEGGKKAVIKVLEGIKVQSVVSVLEEAGKSRIKDVILVR